MTDQELTRLLHNTRESSFGEQFQDRVVDRIQQEKSMEAEWISVMWLRFRQVAAIALILALGIGIYNLRRGMEINPGQAPLNSMIGLPPLSIESAFYQPLISDVP